MADGSVYDVTFRLYGPLGLGFSDACEVIRITEDSQADGSQIQVGDRLTHVSGQRVSSLRDADRELKGAGRPLIMKFVRLLKDEEDDEERDLYTVTFKRDGPLGLLMGDYCRVNGLSRDSQAEDADMICAGDRLYAVDGIRIHTQTDVDCALRNPKRPLVIKFRRVPKEEREEELQKEAERISRQYEDKRRAEKQREDRQREDRYRDDRQRDDRYRDDRHRDDRHRDDRDRDDRQRDDRYRDDRHRDDRHRDDRHRDDRYRRSDRERDHSDDGRRRDDRHDDDRYRRRSDDRDDERSRRSDRPRRDEPSKASQPLDLLDMSEPSADKEADFNPDGGATSAVPSLPSNSIAGPPAACQSQPTPGMAPGPCGMNGGQMGMGMCPGNMGQMQPQMNPMGMGQMPQMGAMNPMMSGMGYTGQGMATPFPMNGMMNGMAPQMQQGCAGNPGQWGVQPQMGGMPCGMQTGMMQGGMPCGMMGQMPAMNGGMAAPMAGAQGMQPPGKSAATEFDPLK
mmetsp:Transcript_31407/g.57698  ORF Transcript_31407/g.57698 Transcript_31407/m.57698 type:complete len:510 (+) Transcript_31407:73-1602(+)